MLVTLSWTITFSIGYHYKNILLYVLIKPSIKLLNEKPIYFIYTTLNELFYTYINLLITTSNSTCLIIFIYHIYKFLKPSMYTKESTLMKQMLILISIIWYMSLFLIYYAILPLSWEFFMSIQKSLNDAQLSFFFEAKLNEYLALVASIFKICLLNTLLISVLFFITYKSIHLNSFMKKQRKYFYFVFFILASIITPPDLISQLTIGSLSVIVFELYTYVLFVLMHSKNSFKVTN